MIPKLAVLLLAGTLGTSRGAGALDTPIASVGDETTYSSEQRFACQAESRRRFKGPRRVDAGLYARVVERRHVYFVDCMATEAQDVQQTGSILVPQPPRRPMANQLPPETRPP